MLYNITKSIGMFVGKQASIAVTSFKVGYELGLKEVEKNEIGCDEPLHDHHDGCPDCDVPDKTGFENDPNADHESPYGHIDGIKPVSPLTNL